jgi:hypothetical protein
MNTVKTALIGAAGTLVVLAIMKRVGALQGVRSQFI